jgi:hypothetical protein
MKRQCNTTSDTNYKVILEPHYLDEKENDQRTKRLSKKILACVRSSVSNDHDSEEQDGFFKKDYEKIFGIA